MQWALRGTNARKRDGILFNDLRQRDMQPIQSNRFIAHAITMPSYLYKQINLFLFSYEVGLRALTGALWQRRKLNTPVYRLAIVYQLHASDLIRMRFRFTS